MKTKPPTIRRLASEYLQPALLTTDRGFHRVGLTPDPEQAGTFTLILDPNICTLDPYGEPRGCTRMMTFGYPVQLERVQDDGVQTLYDIVSRQPLPARMRLVLIHAPKLEECPARILTLADDDTITAIVHLHPTERPNRSAAKA